MIRVRYKPASGDLWLELKGHTDTDICAAASAIVQTAGLGLKALARCHPGKVHFEEVSADEDERAPP